MHLTVKVDHDVSPSEIVERSGLNPKHWAYRGSTPTPNPAGVEMVGVVIVTFDKTMTIGEIMPWVEKQTSFRRGSGAWVREAYLRARPDYDGKGPILFPDEGRSLWADTWETRGDGICVPGLWHDNGRMGPRDLNWRGGQWRAGNRVALTVK